jgi:outer membrane protein insertion porin family
MSRAVVSVLMRGLLAGLTLSLSLLFVAPASAQSYSFSQVAIEGNARVEPATILSYAGIPRGQPVSTGELNDAYQRLVNSGLFEAVDLDPQGGTLVIRVTEYPTVNLVNIEGNRRLDDEDLLPLLQSTPRRVYSPSVAEQDAATLVEAYEARGRLAATVTPKIIRRSDNRVDLVFEVVEGRVVEVERLSFVGNRSFSDYRLRRVLETKQAGVFRQLVQRDTFVAERLEFDKQVLRDFYLSRGYVDFRVLSVSSEFSRERNAFFLTFTVEEGREYRFGNVTVVSEVPEANADDYAPQIRARSGQIYTPSLVENTIARMEALALRQGLTFVRVDPRVTRNDRAGTLDIEFALVRGDRIFVERIDIEGNQTTLDRVIRTQFRTAEGDPFNPREIREASERIRALGFFSNAEVQARQGSSADQVIVDVDVAEKPTGSLSFGGTYSQDAGVGIAVSFSEANFLGRGQAVQFEITTTEGSRNYVFDFAEPTLLGRDLTGRISLTYRTTDNFNAEYSTAVGKFSPQLEFPVSENGRLGVRYSLNYTSVFDVDPDSSALIVAEEEEGPSWQSGPGYTYTYDTRRTGLDPLGGVLLRFSQDFYGLGGNSSLVKTQLEAGVERRVLNEEVTVRAVIEAGAVNTLNGGASRLTDRFILNSSHIRGFEYGGIGPRDLAAPNEDALGGNYFAVARFETDFPLGLPEEYGISGGAFLDVGTLWGLDDTGGGLTGNDPVDDKMRLRASIGLSVFWDTPIGPLRLNFSQPLMKEDYDRTQNFDITVQTRF